ncbi:MAG: hypothetical protein J1F22_03180 [Lachnospiraceae bacterium]|nr:hypothetical protein [Lachnospiraceae bacterium]
MTALEIIFLIIGFLCICGSFFIAGKQGMAEEQGEDGFFSDVWTEKDERIIKERISEILEERQADLVDETEDNLNRLCNEKIMAIDEFSRQLLGKIDSNHQEVVFMYNLLTEKEKNIKDIMAASMPVKEPAPEPEKAPKPETKPASAKAPAKAPAAKPVSAKTSAAKPASAPATAPKAASAKAALSTPKPASAKAPTKAPAKEPESKTKTNAAPAKTQEKKKAAAPSVPERKEEKTESSSQVNVPGNVNLQIQKMYKEGKSILEISKALDIGQGEVKLVIALYGGKIR